MPLHLQIFEERYKLMLQQALRSSQTFGVCLIRNGEEALGPLPEPFMVGCSARIIQMEPQEDGRINVSVVGDERFRIIHLATVQPYLTGFVESLPLDKPASLEVLRGSQILRKRLIEYLAMLAKHTSPDGEDLHLDIDLTDMHLPDDALMLIYLASALLQIPGREKQPLLESETAHKLLVQVMRLYRRELALLPNTLSVSEEQASTWAMMN